MAASMPSILMISPMPMPLPISSMPGVRLFQIELEKLLRRARRRFTAGRGFVLKIGEIVGFYDLLPILIAYGEAESSKARGAPIALVLRADKDELVEFGIFEELPGFRWDWALEHLWEAISFIEPDADGSIDLQAWLSAVAWDSIHGSFVPAGCMR